MKEGRTDTINYRNSCRDIEGKLKENEIKKDRKQKDTKTKRKRKTLKVSTSCGQRVRKKDYKRVVFLFYVILYNYIVTRLGNEI